MISNDSSLRGEGKVDDSCLGGVARDKVLCCMLPPNLYAFIKTPMFISENTCDSYQLQVQGHCPATLGPTEVEYVGYVRNQLAGSLSETIVSGVKKDTDGLYAPACLQHCMDWNDGPEIGGRTLAEAFGDWYFGRATEASSMSLDNNTNINTLIACSIK